MRRYFGSDTLFQKRLFAVGFFVGNGDVELALPEADIQCVIGYADVLQKLGKVIVVEGGFDGFFKVNQRLSAL